MIEEGATLEGMKFMMRIGGVLEYYDITAERWESSAVNTGRHIDDESWQKIHGFSATYRVRMP